MMKFNQEMYSEDVGEQISQALQQTVKKLASRTIDDTDMECQACGSEELKPKAEDPDEEEIRGYCKCAECGERMDIDIDHKNLNSALKP